MSKSLCFIILSVVFVLLTLTAFGFWVYNFSNDTKSIENFLFHQVSPFSPTSALVVWEPETTREFKFADVTTGEILGRGINYAILRNLMPNTTTHLKIT